MNAVEDRKHCVYKYTFPDGKIYIGMTSVSIKERLNSGYNHNKKLKAAISKYGWNGFEVEILQDDLTREEAFICEKELIRAYNATDENIGYNISNGGKNTFEGLKHTKEYRGKMSNLLKGRKFSAETIRRSKEAHKWQCKPVFSFKDGVLQKKYESLGEAAKDVSGYKSNVARACKSGTAYKGLFWFFERG